MCRRRGCRLPKQPPSQSLFRSRLAAPPRRRPACPLSRPSTPRPPQPGELVATELHDKWGGKASPEQLAAGLSSSPTSGAFRIKVATARTFGAITTARGVLALTALGRKLIDPQTQATARVEAFMTVPLFAALADEYKGVMLPPDSGLERKIHDLGVSAKQAVRARQAFQRSAELAGFFRQGRQRLVPPPDHQQDRGGDKGRDEPGDRRADSTKGSVTPNALVDLWITLLDEGASWPPGKIKEYLDTARKLRTLLSEDD